MPTKVTAKAPKSGPKGEKKSQNLGSSKSGLMKNSQLMSRSIAESRGRLHAPSRRWRDGELREGEDEMDEAWLAPKQVLKPEDQLQLGEKELKEEITRILTADNPHAPHNVIQFNFKENSFKHVAHVEQFAMHFTLDGNLLHEESDEAQRQLARDEDEEEDEDENAEEQGDEEAEGEEKEEEDKGGETAEKKGKGGKKLKNQFNYSERASQTYNYPLRERSTMTEPPPRANFSATANQMEIFDAYVEELKKQKKEKEKKGAKSIAKDEDKPVGKKTMGDLQGNDDVTRVSNALKIMERMVNQNTYDDIAQDFKYYDDPSDEFQDAKGTLLPLWKFKYEKTKRMAVTSMCWNPQFNDLLAVGHGMYDFGDLAKGVVCFHSLKNPTYPEMAFELDSGVMCLHIHPKHAFLMAVGLYDGSVCVYNTGNKTASPMYRSTAKTGKHADPVWQISWQNNSEDDNLNFYSVSSDGRVVSWTIVKNELRCEDVALLTTPTKAGDVPDESSAPVVSAGTCFDFNQTSQHLFLVGSEEGNVYKCSKAFTGHFTDIVQSHHLAVYSLRWNPFHSSVFASCGADWAVKIWDNNMKTPMFVFDLNSVVSDVAWSPYASTVFAACTAEGKIHIFDLNVNKYEPLCIQSVILKKKTKLTRIAFNPYYPILVVGDDRGCTTSLKLSPNLRKAVKEKTYSKENEVAKMEKLMSFVKEPLLEKK
jgi:dynein intermediate chain 1